MNDTPRKPPIGNDAMVATPTGQGLSQQLDLVHQAQAQGKTTVSENDLALLKSRVEAQVKQLIASGATDAQIQQAVAGMAATPELAHVAREMAQQQLDAEKFNLFSTRGAAGEKQFAFLDMGKTTEALADNQFSPNSTQNTVAHTIVKGLLGL